MTRRAGNWDLVGRSGDPVPTDPQDVADEASDYADVAATIKSQVYRLRRMSESDDDLKGHFADELKKSMGDLADQLDKIYGRFDSTSDELYKLQTALEEARRGTKAALDDAVTEQESSSGDEETTRMPWEKSGPEKACDRAMDTFDSTAEGIARRIKDAADDDMKEGFWDKVKAVVDAIAPLLKAIKILITVALVVLAIAALFIPGLNMIVLGLLLASLAISVTLAATGNGSWMDVVLDVASIATFGLGSLVGALAKGGRSLFLMRQGASSGRAAFTAGSGFSRFSNGFRAFRDVAGRAPYALPRGGTGSIKELLKSGFNRDMVAHVRDIAQITSKFPKYNPSQGLLNTWTMLNGTNLALTVNSTVGLPSAISAVRD